MIVYGVHPVEEALKRAPEVVEEILLAGGPRDAQFQAILELAGAQKIRRRHLEIEELDELAEGGNHQRVAARLKEFPYVPLQEVLAATEDNPQAVILALSQVQDPGNLGAILRSAAALGVDAVLVPKHRAAPVTASAIRASAGMAFHLPVVQVTNLAKSLQAIKEHGFWVLGTVVEGGQPLWEMDWKMKAAVVLGGEHKGVRPGVEKGFDFRVTIPLAPEVESLNVSTAAAVILYDRLRGISGP